MGTAQSKQTTAHRTNEHRGTPSSSEQGKHNSANSNTPLNPCFAELASLPSPTSSAYENCQWTVRKSKASPFSRNHSNEVEKANITSSTTNQSSAHHPNFLIDEFAGHSNISRPPPPPRIRRLSELIDPAELPIDVHIRSPSGNLLAPEQFLIHPERPLSIRERQMEIREKIRAASRLGVEVEEAVRNRGQTPEVSSPFWLMKCCCFR